jgi:hypothetical protein
MGIIVALEKSARRDDVCRAQACASRDAMGYAVETA